jgi:hypothetical protein
MLIIGIPELGHVGITEENIKNMHHVTGAPQRNSAANDRYLRRNTSSMYGAVTITAAMIIA